MAHALLWLPGACIRRLSIALALTALGCVSGSAFAYPAQSGFTAAACTHTTSWAATAADACQLIPASGPSSPGVLQSNSCSLNNNLYSVAFSSVNANGACVGSRSQSNGTFPGFIFGTTASALGCPNGGTLSGNNCVCPPGYTDTGSACNPPSQPAACPEGQFRELADGACIEKCPVNQGNGAMEYPAPGSRSEAVCGQRMKLGGLGVMDYQGNEILCQYAGTGVTVCADTGGGMMCHSEMTYGLGKTCSAETDVPPDTTPCSAGELYCDKNGACPSGYNAGDFNGRALCVKSGEAVQTVERKKSPLDPPKDPPLPPAPNPIPNAETGANDPNPEIFDSVVNVGDKAVKGGGGGAGGGGGEDIITCGLPNTPKCKIDETGTPTKGDFGDATKSLNDAAKAREDGLSDVTSSQGKQTSWAWNLALPSGCQPLSLNMFIKTVVFDPCAYQPVFHDLMSLLWAGATLFAVFGLVGRTLREA